MKKETSLPFPCKGMKKQIRYEVNNSTLNNTLIIHVYCKRPDFKEIMDISSEYSGKTINFSTFRMKVGAWLGFDPLPNTEIKPHLTP